MEGRASIYLGQRRCTVTQRRDAVARAGPKRCGPGGLMGRGCGRNGRTFMIGLLVCRLAPKTWRESLARFAPDNMSVETAKEVFSSW